MTEAKGEYKPLSKKHRAFVENYLTDFNGTQAYLRVYPKAAYDSAKTSAAELLTKDNIKAEIRARLDAMQMTADEALKRYSEIARGDMAQLMDISSVGFNMDMARAQELGLTKLIKKVKQKTTTFIAKKESDEDREVTELEVELYDAQSALRDILKMHGRFTDKIDIMSGGDKLIIEIVKASDASKDSGK
jgi:phage terminase small subunit